MKIKKLVSACTLALLAGAAQAKDFNYNYFELNIGESETDFAEADVVSFGVNGQLANGVLLSAGYANTEFDKFEVGGVDWIDAGLDLELDLFAFSFGYATQLDDNAAAHVRFTLATGETDSNLDALDGEDVDQIGISAGGRYWLAPDAVELFGDIGWAETEVFDDEDDGVSIGFGVRAHLAEVVTIGLSFTREFDDDDTDTVALQGRLQF